MPTTTWPEDVSARAWRIYEEQIAPTLRPADKGRFLAVDVDTGGYEIDIDEIAVMRRARGAHPDGTLHLIRIGSRTVGRIGARMRPVDR